MSDYKFNIGDEVSIRVLEDMIQDFGTDVNGNLPGQYLLPNGAENAVRGLFGTVVFRSKGPAGEYYVLMEKDKENLITCTISGEETILNLPAFQLQLENPAPVPPEEETPA